MFGRSSANPTINGRSLILGAFMEDPVRTRPNKRLKLAGGDRSSGNGVLCPGGHELSFNDTARGERVARSLSAIR